MSSKYKLERWIVVFLMLLFVVPFIADAESYYVKLIEKRAARAVEPEPAVVHGQVHPTADCPLPEELMPSAVDGEPADECC